MIDVAAEIEKRKLRDQQIFTSITNETRLESLSMIRKIRQEMKLPLGSLPISSQPLPGDTPPPPSMAAARYLNEIQTGNEMMKEIEQILHKAVPKLEPKLEMKHSSSAPHGVARDSGLKMKALNRNSSTHSLARRQRNRKLAPLEERYGNITESWQRGPIDIPKDRYFDLNDPSICGSSQDPRARQLKQQTRCLMNSLTTMSRQARVNATCRKRVVENSQEIGEDHVVESLDRFLPGDLSHPGQGRAIFQSALEDVTYRKRKARRRVNGRIDEVWEILGAPPGSKLGFKLHSETVSPQVLSERLATQREGVGLANDESATALPSSVSIIFSLEKLVDSLHIIDLLCVLLRKWTQDDSLPRIFSSNDLMQPLTTLLRGVGITKGAKKPGDDICDWMVLMLEKLEQLSGILLSEIRILTADLADVNFAHFLTCLSQTIRAMVKSAQRMATKASPVEGEEDIGEIQEDCASDASVAMRSLSHSRLPSSVEISGEILTIESGLSSPSEVRKRGGKLSEGQMEMEGEHESEELIEKPFAAPAAPHPRNVRSLKVRQSLQPIEEVVRISELERFHSQKPNSDLLSRVQKRLEESAKERAADPNQSP